MHCSLSIIIPIFNEEKNINPLTLELSKNLKNFDHEILFIDDNSIDCTIKELKEVKKKFKNVKYIIRNEEERDLTQSCFLGIKNSKYQNILIMDGDGQHQPLDIINLTNMYVNQNLDLVIGCRNFNQLKGSLSSFRTISSKILVFITNFILKAKFKDPMSGFFIFNKEIFYKNEQQFFGKGYKVLLDIIVNSPNIRVGEVTINFKNRKFSESKMNTKILFILINFLFLMIKKNLFRKKKFK